jgi:peptidoglycan hydrolase-like protein with peptidoglycan-binding domain
VQWYLWKLDYLAESDIDGAFGPTTLAAVKAFQTDLSLDVDGRVGPATRTALKNSYN